MQNTPLPPAQTQPTQRRIPPLGWVLMLALAVIWGGSFTANHVALAEVGVLTTVAFRVTGASVFLWIWVIARGLEVPKGAVWLRTCLALGLLNNVIPFSLIVWGQTHIPSGLAGILNAATSVFSVLIAALVFSDERLTARKAVGVALGFAGVVLAVGPEALRGFNLGSLAQLAILAAALSYSIAAVYARGALKGVRAEVGAAGMLTAASLIMLPLALLREGVPTFDYAPATWAALLYLAFVASALAYMIFYMVLAMAGAGNLGLVTLMVAPFAILMGAIGFGEVLPPLAYVGFAALALGLLVIDGRILHWIKR